jgi:8-oxo-dGTP diphosphatase
MLLETTDKPGEYVLGFVFSPYFKDVLLIRKQRPAWQKGLFNGIGGHMKEGETECEAMTREFYEETGLLIYPRCWIKFGTMKGSKWLVHCFTTKATILFAKTKNDEEVIVVPLSKITPNCTALLDNLCCLISLAKEAMTVYNPPTLSIIYRN